MEKIGIDIFFEEFKIRGSKNVECVIRAVLKSSHTLQNEAINVKNWEEVKVIYPTLEHILQRFSYSFNLTARWGGENSIIYIKNIEGHEGLYDFSGEVFYKCGTSINSKTKK